MPQHLGLLFWLLVAVLISRLLPMAMMPLLDTTEARYAEVARIMAESRDWITPWFDYEVPFWGKPPLSFWLEALSFRLFGVTEFAARLPSWLANLGVLALIFQLTRALVGQRQALIATLLFSTMALTYVMSGAVLTDPFLVLGTSLSLVSIILALKQPSSPWVWWLFVGLAIGLLAKGPLALVLIGGPIILWVIWRRQYRDLLQLPWFKGALLTALLTLPWYIAAEMKTPGFLNYFIIGEHFLRFVDSGWSGDLYGNAHDQAYGTIWLYWIWASFPWGPIAIVLLIRHWVRARKNSSLSKQTLSDEQRLLLLSALFPSLFFTFSGNILWTYQLPALVPLAILLAMLVTNSMSINKFSKFGLAPMAVFVLIVGVSMGFRAYFYPDQLKTERALVAHYVEHKERHTPALIYLTKVPFSARFYSNGNATARTLPEFEAMLQNNSQHRYFLAVPKRHADEIISSVNGQATVEFVNRRFTLLKTASADVNKSLLSR